MLDVYVALTDLRTRLQSIAALRSKTFICYDPPDLERQLFAAAPPAVGVVYEGMRSQSEQGNTRAGLAVLASFGLYLLIDTPSIGTKTDQKGPALSLLSEMRDQIIADTAPAGHRWRFVVESIAKSDKDRTLWVQRWDTPGILAH